MSNISPILSTNLNTSSLPPVFQIPQKMPRNDNINLSIHSKVNLKPIKNNKSNNIIPVTYMNNSSYDNPVFKIRGKPLLKPINMNETRKKISRNHNISDVNFNYSEINKNKSPEKFSKTSQYYFQMMQNMQNQMGKTQISKLEKNLRDLKMNSISINQNKNMIDKNIVILKNKLTNDNLNIDKNYKSSVYANKTTYLANKKNYLNSIKEFIPINKNKNLMLHLPTLKLYYCFNISYKNFEKVEEYIIQWKKIDHISIEIMCIFDNETDEYYQIMVEKNKNGNLNNLIKSMGNINEYILKNMTKQLIPIIQIYNKKIKIRNLPYYNIIDVNNIYFDHRYNIKIFPGCLYLNNEDDSIIYDLFEKINLKKDDSNYQLIIDLYNLGITLLNCNLKILNCSIKDCLIMNNNNSLQHNENCCCLFHCISNHNDIFSDLFKNLQFSDNYFDFIHQITLFNKDNFNLDLIINHSWLITNTNNNINPKNNIDELIKLGKLYDFENEYYTSISNVENFDLLCYYISNKLKDCEEYFNYYSIKNANMIFSTLDSENLSKELKVYEDDIENKLFTIYNSYFSSQLNNTIN
jgi:hypothetical protein